VTAAGSSADVVRRFLDLMEARDWPGARSCVADDAVVVYPVTGERFSGRSWMDMNEAYPEGWAIEIAEIVDRGNRAAARVRVTLAGEVSWCAGFYTTVDGRITDAVELWTTEHGETPPEWRGPYWI
jgi:ketosteroid isomerase-like protein